MDYEQAAKIALERAQRDGLVRYVYLRNSPTPRMQELRDDAPEEWMVEIVLPDRPLVAVIHGTMREIPPKPEAV